MFIHIGEISSSNTQYTVSFINFCLRCDTWMSSYYQNELPNQPWILLSEEYITNFCP